MVRYAASDRPDVLCLQELPVWASAHLSEWSGMQAYADVAQPPRLGPLPIPAAQRLADAELFRAAVFADGLAQPGDIIALAGDFNVPAPRSATQAELASEEWGFSEPTGEGIDQILVRGALVDGVTRWPVDRR